jgi:hypothetical protein
MLEAVAIDSQRTLARRQTPTVAGTAEASRYSLFFLSSSPSITGKVERGGVAEPNIVVSNNRTRRFPYY